MPLTTDQRGAVRPAGGACDIGAFEVSEPFKCSYSLRPASVFLPSGQSAGAMSVLTSTSECAWTAATDVNWITVTAVSGAGNGTVTFTVAPNPGGPRSGTVSLMGNTVTVWQAGNEGIHTITAGDFDGDSRADITVFRPTEGRWYVATTTGGMGGGQWGSSGDWPVPADYDGDGRTDAAVYRPSTGTWYMQFSSNGSAGSVVWGNFTDIPVVADYEGDGRADLAVYRPSTGTWYVRFSSMKDPLFPWGQIGIVPWGNWTDLPVVADYDGDRRADIAVYRPSTGTWYLRFSSTGAAGAVAWGISSDVPVPGDYDGDGFTDLTVYRPGQGAWYIRYTATGETRGFLWGNTADRPVPGDYDGDGATDLAVFRPSTGTWYIWYSSNGTAAAFHWGNSGDLAIPWR
jgi:hypothetical protein